jgi:hypothetical protein
MQHLSARRVVEHFTSRHAGPIRPSVVHIRKEEALPKRKSTATRSRRTVFVSRAFYFDAIREVIAESDLTRMRTVSKQAKELLRARLEFKKTSDAYDKDLRAAIERLDKSIQKRGQKA